MRRLFLVAFAGAALVAARSSRAGTSPAPTARPAPATLQFPRDHGSHPDAAIEWWYYTGHLAGTTGRHYGFQLTFFRLGDVHLAHFAISDIAGQSFVYDEKMHLGLPGIAGSAQGGLDVFNEDWFSRARAEGNELSATMPAASLALTLRPRKPPVLQGENGLSRKGPGANEYSHYVSVTRFSAAGEITRAGRRESVTGTAWFDHEWGPGALPEGAAGWDWFALQMDDGSDLMLFRMRQKGAAATPFSSGTFVPAGGAPRPIAWKDVRLAPTSSWTSPHSKAIYPASWSLSVASVGLTARITPLLADQELSTTRSTGVTYWEGACKVEGTRDGRPIGGRAYVEMTGYAGRDVPGFNPP